MEQVIDSLQSNLWIMALGIIKSLLCGFAIGFVIALAIRFLLKAVNKNKKGDDLIGDISSKVCAFVTLCATLFLYFNVFGMH